jgi:hypothetical protein
MTQNTCCYITHHYWGVIKILEIIWKWAKEQLTPQKLNNIDSKPLALGSNKLEDLGKLWECANEELTPQEPRNKSLLNKEDKERYAWHVAAKMGNVSVLKKLWMWAKEKQTTDELTQNSFFAKRLMGRTAWHDAAETNNTNCWM